MTLILTEITRFGIAMSADSAVTRHEPLPGGQYVPKVLLGIKKLQKIPKLQAGVSIWGQGRINDVRTDIWLENFIRTREDEYDTIGDFAILLQKELRMHIPDIDVTVPANEWGTIGFHLAGFVEWEGEIIPTFYHIHNGRSQALEERGIMINPKRINANHDLPPQLARELIEQGIVYTTHNGDYRIYVELFSFLRDFFRNLATRRRVIIPYSRSLKDRAEWLKFQIKTMADLYSFSNLPVSVIGGDIATLTISAEEGITSYETR